MDQKVKEATSLLIHVTFLRSVKSELESSVTLIKNHEQGHYLDFWPLFGKVPVRKKTLSIKMLLTFLLECSLS